MTKHETTSKVDGCPGELEAEIVRESGSIRERAEPGRMCSFRRLVDDAGGVCGDVALPLRIMVRWGTRCAN